MRFPFIHQHPESQLWKLGNGEMSQLDDFEVGQPQRKSREIEHTHVGKGW